jgi:hypothetical protein
LPTRGLTKGEFDAIEQDCCACRCGRRRFSTGGDGWLLGRRFLLLTRPGRRAVAATQHIAMPSGCGAAPLRRQNCPNLVLHVLAMG